MATIAEELGVVKPPPPVPGAPVPQAPQGNTIGAELYGTSEAAPAPGPENVPAALGMTPAPPVPTPAAPVVPPPPPKQRTIADELREPTTTEQLAWGATSIGAPWLVGTGTSLVTLNPAAGYGAGMATSGGVELARQAYENWAGIRRPTETGTGYSPGTVLFEAAMGGFPAYKAEEIAAKPVLKRIGYRMVEGGAMGGLSTTGRTRIETGEWPTLGEVAQGVATGAVVAPAMGALVDKLHPHIQRAQIRRAQARDDASPTLFMIDDPHQNVHYSTSEERVARAIFDKLGGEEAGARIRFMEADETTAYRKWQADLQAQMEGRGIGQTEDPTLGETVVPEGERTQLGGSPEPVRMVQTPGGQPIGGEGALPPIPEYIPPSGAAEPPAPDLPHTVVRDQSGAPRKMYHGTPRDFGEFEPDNLSETSLYGPGVYLTSDPQIAGQYATATRFQNERMSEADRARHFVPGETIELPDGSRQRVLDYKPEGHGTRFEVTVQPVDADGNPMEAPFTHSQNPVLGDAPTTPNIRPAYVDVRNPLDVRTPEGEAYYQQMVEDYGGSKADVNDVLGQLGYDGILYDGGKIRGNRPHDVVVAFNPEQVHDAFSLEAQARGQQPPLRAVQGGGRSPTEPRGVENLPGFTGKWEIFDPGTGKVRFTVDTEAAARRASGEGTGLDYGPQGVSDRDWVGELMRRDGENPNDIIAVDPNDPNALVNLGPKRPDLSVVPPTGPRPFHEQFPVGSTVEYTPISIGAGLNTRRAQGRVVGYQIDPVTKDVFAQVQGADGRIEHVGHTNDISLAGQAQPQQQAQAGAAQGAAQGLRLGPAEPAYPELTPARGQPGDEGAVIHPIHDAAGNEVGVVQVLQAPDGVLYVEFVGPRDNITVGPDAAPPLDLGLGGSRRLLRELRTMYPDATRIAGYRTTGVAAGGGRDVSGREVNIEFPGARRVPPEQGQTSAEGAPPGGGGGGLPPPPPLPPGGGRPPGTPPPPPGAAPQPTAPEPEPSSSSWIPRPFRRVLGRGKAQTGQDIPGAVPAPADERLDTQLRHNARVFGNETPEVQQIIDYVTRDQAGQTRARGRERQPVKRTIGLAQDMVFDPEIAAALPKGTTLRADEQLAVGQATVQLGQEIVRLRAELAAHPNDDLVKLRLQKAVNALRVTHEFYRGAATEAGRTLHILKAQAEALQSGDHQFLREAAAQGISAADIEATLSDPTLDDAGRFKKLLALRDFDPVDKVYTYLTQNVLSGIQTQERNIVGNLVPLVRDPLTRPLRGLLSKAGSAVTGKPRHTYVRETGPLLEGYAKAVLPGLRGAGEILWHGHTQEQAANYELPPVELFRNQGPVVRRIANGVLRGLNAADFGVRSLHEKGELFSLAYRNARNEVDAEVRAGKIPKAERKAALKDRIQQYRDNPTEEMLTEVKKVGARGVYQQSRPLDRQLLALRDTVPGGRFVLWFVRTPLDIMRQGAQLTPAGMLTKSARPQVSPHGKIAEHISAKRAAQLSGPGGREAAQARTEAIVGSTLMMTWLASLAAQGKLTGAGPTDPAEIDDWRAQGKQPNSIQIGGKWYGYGVLAPLAIPMATIANGYEESARLDKMGVKGAGQRMQHIAAQIARGLYRTMLQQSYLKGFSDVQDAFDDETGEKWAKLTSNFAAMAAPWSGMQRNIAQAEDPVVRKPSGFEENLRLRFPGSHEDIPPRIRATGEPVVSDKPWGFLGRLLLPTEVSTATDTIMRREMRDIGVKLPVPKGFRFGLDEQRHPIVPERGELFQIQEAKGRLLTAALTQLVMGDSSTELTQEWKDATPDERVDAAKQVKSRVSKAISEQAKALREAKIPITLETLWPEGEDREQFGPPPPSAMPMALPGQTIGGGR